MAKLLLLVAVLVLLPSFANSTSYSQNSAQQVSHWRRWRAPTHNRVTVVADNNHNNRNKYWSPRKVDVSYNTSTNAYYGRYKPARKLFYPLFRPPPPCLCGMSNGRRALGGRIVGGRETEVMAYPWVTHLTHEEGYFLCGGTLVTDRHVVTAAHCLRNLDPRTLWATVGDHDRSRLDEAKSIRTRVRAATIHPGYERASFDNDIAVLLLCRPVLTPAIRPICLPPPRTPLVDRDVLVVGWGKTDEPGSFLSDKLHEVGVKVVSRETCLRMPLEPYETLILTDTMICAGVPQGGKDACQGDSGGAMMLELSGRWFFVGIVSKGFGCAEPGRFGIYTRVDLYLDWLRYVTHGGIYCRY